MAIERLHYKFQKLFFWTTIDHEKEIPRKMITADQLRAARGLLDWTQEKLARASGVALSTVKRMEASQGLIRANTGNAWKVQKALQWAGIELIDDDGGDGAGVRWKKKKA